VSTKAEIYAYSAARGLFAGVALDGTVITISDGANGRFYGKPAAPASEILSGAVTNSSENLRRFQTALAASIGETSAGTPQGTPPATTPVTSPAAQPAQTFPMEDPK
jgi:hypothetical protein